jgi:PAS domain S-box-containing protein
VSLFVFFTTERENKMAKEITDLKSQIVRHAKEINFLKQKKDEIASRMAMYRDFVEDTKDLFTQVDNAGNFTFVNSSAEKVFGLKPKECIGLSAFSFIHPDDQQETKDQFQQYISEGVDSGTFENRQVSKDGRITYMLWTSKFQYDDDGKLTSVVGIARDISERKKIEDELREAEGRFSAFMENIPGVAFIKDNEGRHLFCNRTLEELISKSRDDWFGKTNKDLFPADIAREFDENDQQVLAADDPSVGIEPVQTKKGTQYWLVTKFPILGTSGIKYLGGVGIDITEKRKTEEDIIRAKRDWENTFDAVQDLIMIVDRGFKIQRVNMAMAEKLGLTPQTTVGKFCYDVIKCTEEERIKCPHQELLIKGEPQSLEIFEEALGGYYYKSVFPIHESKGIISGSVHLFRDINEQKKIEEALQESEERFRSIMEYSPSVIELYDQDGLQTYVNNAYEKLWGFPASHTVDKFNVLQSEEVENTGLIEYVKRAYGGEVVTVPDYKFDSTGTTEAQGKGRVRWLSTRIYPLKDKDGNVENIVISHEDVSEIKFAEEERIKLEKQLRHAVKMEAIGTLAGGIAHDFNNILGIILGYAEMAKEDAPQSGEISKQIDSVIKAGIRGKELVKHILAFSRKIEQEIVPVELDILVKESLKLLRASIPTTIEIRQNINAQAPVIMADPTQIHQVLINLCTNAASAMEENGGILRIDLSKVYLLPEEVVSTPSVKPGTFVKLSVSDTGEGMDREIVERVFEPFFTTKQQEKGTGMGLAVVHGIVSSLGGIIRVESKPGQGTVFDVFFPASEGREVWRDEETPSIEKGNEHVLFVDDEQMMVEMGQAVLERLGYEVTAMTSADEALEVFKANTGTFDLVITDQTMPYKTGVQFSKELLAIKPDLPIILCTGFSKKISEKDIKAIGIRELALKPLEIKKMAEIIRRVLDAGN